MLNILLTQLVALQSLIIIFGSIYVLQGVLHKCSKLLRLTFVIFPIASSIEFLDTFYSKNVHISLIALNLGVILILYWLWNQKSIFTDLEQFMRNTKPNKPYKFVGEIKAILSCFAIWLLREVNLDFETRCVVCEQILPKS